MAYWREVATMVAVCSLLAACGSVGEPQPPLLKIPEAVPELSVEQVEDEIVVRWAWPTETTEGTPLKNLALFRVHGKQLTQGEGAPSQEQFAAGNQLLASFSEDAFAALDPDTPVEWRRPAAGWAGQRWVLAVWAEGRNGKSAGFSERMALRVVDPLVRPGPVEAKSAPEGVRVSWPAAPGVSEYRLERANGEGEFRPRGTAAAAEFVDDAVAWDEPYRYRVRAFATSDGARARSALSEIATVTPTDTFPPATPEDLRAIAGPGGVALSWQPGVEADLAGYVVYRAARDGRARVRLHEELLSAPATVDETAQAGQSYVYSVTAVDTRENESEASAAAAITVR